MRKKGFTFTELMVWAVLFALFIILASDVFFWAKKSLAAVRRLDNFSDLRLSAFRIGEELSYGVRILFPPPDNKTYHQLVFRNNRNEIVVIFIDISGKLILIDAEKFRLGDVQGRRVLSDQAIEFGVERPDSHLVKFHVKIQDERKVEFVLANAVKMRNTDINEPW